MTCAKRPATKKPMAKPKAPAKKKIASKGMKPYTYRVTDSPRPETEFSGNYEHDYTDIEKSPLFYRYKKELGSPSDPNAYVNMFNETLVTNLMRHDLRGVTKKMKDFGTHTFRTPESMVKYYNDCDRHNAYLVKGAVVVTQWEDMGHEEWKEKYRQDKNISHKGIYSNYGAFTYASWKNGDVFKSVVIDDPSLETSLEVEHLDSEKKLPKGKVVWESATKYGNQPKYDEDRMRAYIQNNAPMGEHEYEITYGCLKESSIKKLGIEPKDVKIGESFYGNVDGRYMSFKRSKNTKPKDGYSVIFEGYCVYDAATMDDAIMAADKGASYMWEGDGDDPWSEYTIVRNSDGKKFDSDGIPLVSDAKKKKAAPKTKSKPKAPAKKPTTKKKTATKPKVAAKKR